jgi:hypothetical protein
MKITCVACEQRFPLDRNAINAMGSLIKCAECHFIFIVFPQDDFEQTVVQDTNIDQSILNTLFRMENPPGTVLPIDDISEEWNSLMAQGVLPIEDLDEEATAEYDLRELDAECGELPDLSEYEDMIDWDENTDSENPSASPT